MNLSPNFTLEELIATSHRQFDNTPNATEIANLTRLAGLLEKVREVLGKPMIVNSGFRSKQVNDSVGSTDKSQHRLGCAADFRVIRMTPDDVVKAIVEAKLPFDQLIREFETPNGGGWTHISIPNLSTDKPRNQALIIDKSGTRAYT